MVNKSCIVIGVLTVTVLAVTLGIIFCQFNLQKVFMNRCETNLEKFGLASQKDCEKIWDSFTQAFVGKDPSDVHQEAYASLMSTVSQVSQVSKKTEWLYKKRVFWSGISQKTAHDYAEKCSHLTLDETLPAFLLDDVTWLYKGPYVYWCGEKGSQEISTRRCHDGPFKSFWNQSSAAFAASARGEAFVMLDGSRDKSYIRSSTFASVELPNFTSKMKKLTVLLVTEDTKKCESDKSLNDLQNDLGSNFNYQCRVVPKSQLQTCI